MELSEPYIRSLSVSLSIVEDMANDIEELIDDEYPKKIFRKIKNVLNQEKKESIMVKLENINKILMQLKNDLKLNLETFANTSLISSRCGSSWNILCDLETRKMKRYGKQPAELEGYLDPKINDLLMCFKEITELINK